MLILATDASNSLLWEVLEKGLPQNVNMATLVSHKLNSGCINGNKVH